MKTFIDQRFELLLEEIEQFNEMGIAPIKKVTGIVNSVRSAMADLKQYLREDPFANEGDEISFFKYEKPRFYAELIYALELFTIEGNTPVGEELLLKSYYEQELGYIRRFFDQHRFFYQYYLLDGSDLDHLYFLRHANPPKTHLPDGPDLDPEFSTAGDFLLAKFRACERLQEYLIGRLYTKELPKSEKRRPFKWIGDKSDLIEVAYAFYGTRRINEEGVTIAEIIDWLEESFNVNLSRHYRRFSEIKMRKVMSQSKYLDEMREAFLKYIEEGDAWKPRR